MSPPPSMEGRDGLNSLLALTENPDIEASVFELPPGLRIGSIDQALDALAE